MPTVRDHLWIWGHEAGSHNSYVAPRTSRITPVESAGYMGIQNMVMVTYNDLPKPPFDQYVLAMSPLKQIIWSCVGDAGSPRNDFGAFMDIAKKYPNIRGTIMDDFFPATSSAPARRTLQEITDYHHQLHHTTPPLDLWVVLYDNQLHLPLADYLNCCDLVTFWTWKSLNLPKLEDNFKHFENITPQKRKILGIYMYDYGGDEHNRPREMPLDLMEYQCTLGLKWLKEKRIEGMIFLASCICDLNLDAVEWTRQWIQRVGHEPL